MPTFGTVCDGIGCGHLAFNQVGFECAWSFEIEPFPSAVLAYRFPEVTNHGDMLKCVGMIESGEIEAPDVFIGGTPCQAFSVAGKRKGLEDARGNLSLTFCGIADAVDDVRRRDGKPPCVVLWENVPGVLSDKGNAFGCFLGELSGSGCQLQPPGGRWRDSGCVFGPRRTVAWRTLDSQFFGVAQRRRRVFVVASAGDWCRPEEILFEREGVRRDSPPSREKGESVAHDLAPSLTSSGRGVERAGETRGQDPVVAVCPTLSCNHDVPIATYDMRGNGDGETVNTLTGAGRPTDYTPVVAIQERACSPDLNCGPGGKGFKEDGTAFTLEARNKVQAVAFEPRFVRTSGGQPSIELNPCLRADTNTGDGAPCVAIADVIHGDKACNGKGWNDDGTAYTLDTMATQGVAFGGEIARTLSARHDSSPCADRGMDVVAQGMQARRLTPRECERLQALPADWTLIPWRGKPAEECPDGPRYKGIGNGQTVNVMRWLAERIKLGFETMPDSTSQAMWSAKRLAKEVRSDQA